MPVEKIRFTIHGDSPGRQTPLNGFRIGRPGSGPKAYLQAALHSDEQPGIMALHHLLPMLIEADQRGDIQGEFVLFPMVNPLGLGNIEFGMHQGRYDVPSGVNFNRQWPDLFRHVESEIDGNLGGDEQHNIALIRRAAGDWLRQWPARSAREQLRRFTAIEAHDADYVFDLHCDDLSQVHIFSAPHCNDQMQALGAALGATAVLTAEDSGGGSFDEVWPQVFNKAQAKYPKCAIPIPVAACTVELRGQSDVYDDIGKADAEGLFAFFQSEGVIAGEPDRDLSGGVAPTPLSATDVLRVDRAGLLAYKVGLGDRVKKGDVVAELIDLDSASSDEDLNEGAFLSTTCCRWCSAAVAAWPTGRISGGLSREPAEPLRSVVSIACGVEVKLANSRRTRWREQRKPPQSNARSNAVPTGMRSRCSPRPRAKQCGNSTQNV